jgi:putative hydrolase of the HAD superfamily
METGRRPPDILFFDLDDTLYPARTGLWRAIRERMGLYMVERLGMDPQAVPEIRRHYFETYGTTLRGLQKHHQVSTDDYLAYVHDLPLDQYLEPQPELRKMLLSLPQRRLIFTNSDQAHAGRVLRALDLEGVFEYLIDVRAIGFYCKPEMDAFRIALDLAGTDNPAEVAMFDDARRNLAVARRLGMLAVLVGASGDPEPEADIALPGILNLPGEMPFLWDKVRS